MEEKRHHIRLEIRPVESHNGARETILAGALSQFLYVLRARHQDSRGRKRGEGCPLTIRLEVWGNVVSSSSGVRGPKMDFMHI